MSADPSALLQRQRELREQITATESEIVTAAARYREEQAEHQKRADEAGASAERLERSLKPEAAAPPAPARPTKAAPGEVQAAVCRELQAGFSGTVNQLAEITGHKAASVREALLVAKKHLVAVREGRVWSQDGTQRPAPAPAPTGKDVAAAMAAMGPDSDSDGSFGYGTEDEEETIPPAGEASAS